MFRFVLRALYQVLAVFVVSCASMATNMIGFAAAEPCPDIEVVYARGTGAPPGAGMVGDAFVDALRTKVGGRSIAVYGVNYPASRDFGPSASAGAVDARTHVQATADACPDTRIVLGGTSQGAGVIALIISGTAPRGYTPAPLAPEIADHIAAIAVFGNPTRNMAVGPLPMISPVYGPKSIDLCADGDPFCSNGINVFAHLSYAVNGMTDEAADFVAARL